MSRQKKGKQKIIFLTKRKLPNKERTLFNAVIVLRYKINIQAGKKNKKTSYKIEKTVLVPVLLTVFLFRCLFNSVQ